MTQVSLDLIKPDDAKTECLKKGESAPESELSASGLRVFFNIAEAWNLTSEEATRLLGLESTTTYLRWKKNPEIPQLDSDELDRLSYILGIYWALHILLPKKEAADGWIKRPNSAPLFGGRSALQKMLSGQINDLRSVRQYLDAQIIH